MSETLEYGAGVALIVVDVQNDFADPDGSLYVEGGEQVVVAVNVEITRAEAAGSPVFYTQDWHPESTPHFEKDGGIWPVHCVANTWGAEFHPDLLVAGPSIRKGAGQSDGYSGFHVRDSESGAIQSTQLSELLSESRIDKVVVVGLALDYCVKESALDAVGEGLETSLLRHATAAVNLVAGDGKRSEEALLAAGVKVI